MLKLIAACFHEAISPTPSITISEKTVMKIAPGAQFHEQLANTWGAMYERVSFMHRLELFNSILDHTVMSGQIWLDLGCGTGILTWELIKRGARVVAIDASPLMLKEAKKLISTYNVSNFVNFRSGDVQDLSWAKSCTFDGVLCSSVIEYVEYPDKMIQEISRVLVSDGFLIISIPPKKSLIRVIQKIVRRILKQFEIDTYAYLEVSHFEIEPASVRKWLSRVSMYVEKQYCFDPLLPNYMLRIFRPSLLIYEIKKLMQYGN